MEPRTEEDEFYSTPEEFYEDLKKQIAKRDMKFNVEIYYKDEKIRLLQKHIEQLQTHIETLNAQFSLYKQKFEVKN